MSNRFFLYITIVFTVLLSSVSSQLIVEQSNLIRFINKNTNETEGEIDLY